MGVMSNPGDISRLNEAISGAISEAITPYINKADQLEEALADVRMMMDYDEVGWTAITGGASNSEEGLSLAEVKMISQKSRVKIAAGALEKRAAELHGGYVFGNGLEIDGVERDPKAKGAPPGPVRFFENPINQEHLFSDSAKKALQKARFADGNVVAFCDTRSKTVRMIPISEIAGVQFHPEYGDEIIAWLRSYRHYPASGDPVVRKAWVYSNRHVGARQESIMVDNESVPVLEGVTAVDLRANRQTGWAFGVPDSLPGMAWATAYGEVMRYGQIVNESLAKIVYKVVTKTQKTANNVGVKLASAGAGGAAALGEGQDIQLVNSSQRSFDFTAARPLAAMAAAAWNVSNIDLLSDSSAAGSSYGAAQSLVPATQNIMRGIQEEWSAFYADIFEVMGFGRPGIHWAPMEKPDSYRLAQELTLYAPALWDEEYRAIVLDRLDVAGDPTAIPPTLELRSADPKSQAASPDQGRSTDAGASDSGSRNDQRDDTIGETLHAMQGRDFLNELGHLVERLEAAKRD